MPKRILQGTVVSDKCAKTVTVKVEVETLPQSSVAVQVTVVTPTGNTEPLGGVHTRVGVASQLSVTEGAT
jgi:hypothetical protein